MSLILCPSKMRKKKAVPIKDPIDTVEAINSGMHHLKTAVLDGLEFFRVKLCLREGEWPINIV